MNLLRLTVIFGTVLILPLMAHSNDAPPPITIHAERDLTTTYGVKRINLKVTLTNISDHRITLTWGYRAGVATGYRIEARDVNGITPQHSPLGRALYEGAGGAGPIFSKGGTRTLEPGESQLDVIPIDSLFMFSSGVYLIKVNRNAPESDVAVESNTATFEFTEAQIANIKARKAGEFHIRTASPTEQK